MARVALVDLPHNPQYVSSNMGVVRQGWQTGSIALACLCALACSDVKHSVGTLNVASTAARSGAGAGAAQAGSAGASSGTAGTGAGSAVPVGGGGTGTGFDVDAALPEAVPECAANAVPSVAKRLDLYFMVSGNLVTTFTGVGAKLTSGISEYVDRDSSAGVGLGLDFYGFDTCDSSAYSLPEAPVGVDPLPSNADAIHRTLDNNAVSAEIIPPALAAALEGAVAYSRSRANVRPGQTQQAVVLFSDGFLDLACASSSRSMAEIAAAGLPVGVRTFIVELSAIALDIPLFPIGMPLVALDPVAAAGGTGSARTIDLVRDTPADIADLLVSIQRDAQPCDYTLPDGTTWGDAQLAIDTGAGPRPLAMLDDVSACGPSGGVFLDESSGTSWARACPASCQAIRASERSPVWLIGCTAAQMP